MYKLRHDNRCLREVFADATLGFSCTLLEHANPLDAPPQSAHKCMGFRFPCEMLAVLLRDVCAAFRRPMVM